MFKESNMYKSTKPTIFRFSTSTSPCTYFGAKIIQDDLLRENTVA